jgi:primase-like protein
LPPKRLILFKTAEPFKKLSRVFIAPDGSKQALEVHCDGQQFVVHGIHSGTGKPYSWFGGDIETIRHADLPSVRRADMERFLDAAAELLVGEFGFVLKGASKTANVVVLKAASEFAHLDPDEQLGEGIPSHSPHAEPERVAAAVAVIANDNLEWDDWNRVLMAIWRATSGSVEGFRIADIWSRKSAKYNAQNTLEKWNAISKCPPDRIGFGTLKYLADRADPNWESALWVQLMRPPITKRHDIAADSIADHLFRHSCDFQLVLGLLQAWNIACCQPPIDPHELKLIVDRCAMREVARAKGELA